jgi:methylenetetrahydrofolate dehydrogenase (NADP+)/methenyltetrahydrofolate cyclohydrolase
MIILDGKSAARAVKEKILEKTADWKRKGNRPPHLAAVLMGNDGASETYVASKIKNCEEVGFKSSLIRLQGADSERKLCEVIAKLNIDNKVDGILVQLPLASHINETRIIDLINPQKDVDGFHPLNAGKLMQGNPSFIPATPMGIMLLLKHYDINTTGKQAVIIGRSNIVGRPLSVLLSGNSDPGNCTVTLCHSKTKNLKELCLQADIMVAALGKPGFLTGDMIKQGAVVIDVGITRVADKNKKSGFSLKGDVDYENVSPLCSYITPVPGGVGPMTIAALLMNTLTAYETTMERK